MQIKYCLPIVKNKKAEVLEEIQKYKTEYQFFEIWLDYIEDLDEQFVKDLVSNLNDKVIFLFRRKNLEPIKMTFEKLLSIIRLLENTQAFMDLDILVQKGELDAIKNDLGKIKTIISYHNYQETPEEKKLETIAEMMGEYQPTIYKISTFCKSDEDALSLLHLLIKLKQKGKKYIVLGMGEFGTITRIFGTLWGNEMIFAPQTSQEESAPGQLTKKQLEEIFEELEV